jgi:hypothetical protein
MSKVVMKTPDAPLALMTEVEALFEMTPIQREKVEDAIDAATAPETPPVTYEEFYDKAGLAECKVSGQPLEAENYTDADGNPDGGWVEAPGLQIRWQQGPLNGPYEDNPWNGAFPVTVLEAVLHRLEYYQDGKFACQDNNEAIHHIKRTIDTLNKRQIERFCRGVRGSHEK